MATSLRLTAEQSKKMKQLAKEHKRSEHGELLYAVDFYVKDCSRDAVEKIVSFWFSQMRDGSFGEITPQTLYKVIQEKSSHPYKDFVQVEDCSYVDQTDIDEQIRKHGAIIL